MQTDVMEFLLIVKTNRFSTTALIATTFSAILWLKHIKSAKSYEQQNFQHIILYSVVVVMVYYYVSVVL